MPASTAAMPSCAARRASALRMDTSLRPPRYLLTSATSTIFPLCRGRGQQAHALHAVRAEQLFGHVRVDVFAVGTDEQVVFPALYVVPAALYGKQVVRVEPAVLLRSGAVAEELLRRRGRTHEQFTPVADAVFRGGEGARPPDPRIRTRALPESSTDVMPISVMP